jgi:Domain of unknown function (DUF4333)
MVAVAASPTRRVSVVATLLASFSLVGCGSGAHTMTTAGVERSIAASILAQHHMHAEVRCPPAVPRRAGYVFTCDALFAAGSYPIMASETNGAGHVRYRNPAPLAVLDARRVERAIAASIHDQRHLDATVSCPSEVLERSGVRFTCTALVGGRSYPFAVTEVDGEGHVRYVGR